MVVVRSSSREYNRPERRSQRVMLKAPVVILTQGADNKTMFEETQTITVNVDGAMIVSRLKFEAGQIITLLNSRTGEEAPCRVVYLSPRQTENREVASSSWSRVFSSGASLFLLLTGRPKTRSERQQKSIQQLHCFKEEIKLNDDGYRASHVPRYAFIAEAQVTVIATNTTLKARTTDIGIDGCFLDMLNPSPKGTDIRVKISHDGSTFEALGVVVLVETWDWALPSQMLTVIRKRFHKSGFQKQGASQQALTSDLTHLGHLLNDEMNTYPEGLDPKS
jgi:hypothetical protein